MILLARIGQVISLIINNKQTPAHLTQVLTSSAKAHKKKKYWIIIVHFQFSIVALCNMHDGE